MSWGGYCFVDHRRIALHLTCNNIIHQYSPVSLLVISVEWDPHCTCECLKPRAHHHQVPQYF